MGKTVIIGIYIIQNIENNMIYIGQSKDILRRWYNHKKLLNSQKHVNTYLQNSWNKYGEENFTFEILEEYAVYDIKYIGEREIFWIREYNSSNNEFGYNISLGGSSPMAGRKMSEEAKEKISNKLTGRIKTPEHLANISLNHVYKSGKENPLFGKPQSEEQLKKRAKAMEGNKNGRDKKRTNATSKFFGVYFAKGRDGSNGKWCTKIRHDNRYIWIGEYETEIEAAKAYNTYIRKNKIKGYSLNNIKN